MIPPPSTRIIIPESEPSGWRKEVYDEADRNGRRLAVTVVPYRIEGQIVGFIQSFTVKR